MNRKKAELARMGVLALKGGRVDFLGMVLGVSCLNKVLLRRKKRRTFFRRLRLKQQDALLLCRFQDPFTFTMIIVNPLKPGGLIRSMGAVRV